MLREIAPAVIVVKIHSNPYRRVGIIDLHCTVVDDELFAFFPFRQFLVNKMQVCRVCYGVHQTPVDGVDYFLLGWMDLYRSGTFRHYVQR